MSIPFMLAIVCGIALLVVALLDFFDVIVAMIDLLFWRAAALLAGYLIALFALETAEESVAWLGPGDGGALATAGLLASLVAIVVRYKIVDARETATLMRLREQKAQTLAERGVTVDGRVTAIERSGFTINDNPEVRFTITATLQNGDEITVTHERLVDLIDVPQFQPGRRVRVTYDPQDTENLELDWSESPSGPQTSTEALVGTGAPFPWPLWVFGMEDAEAWLLPPRADDRAPVVIIDITDPHDATADDRREKLIDMAAFLLAEHLWVRTDAAASPAVLIHTETSRLLQPVGELADFEGLLPFIQDLEREPVVAWGAALADLDREGVQLKLRVPGDEVERSLAGPLDELTEMLIDWLVRRDLCRRTPTPTWWVAPTGDAVLAYATVLHDLQLQILADEKNEALRPLDPDVHEGFCERALEVAREHGAACPQAKLIAAVIAVYAARADRLPGRLRSQAVELVLSERDESSALFRLSPHLLRQLGDTLAAHSRSTTLERDADGDYLAWLRKIDAL